MREKLVNLAQEEFSDLKLWDYEESQHSCFLRFTSKEAVYVLTCLKNGTHCNLFKMEENITL